MSVFLQPIYTQTVGAGGVGSITFNNIPQTFTDLKVVISARIQSGSFYGNAVITFNGSSTGYSFNRLFGNGIGGVIVDKFSSQSNIYAGEVSGDTATVNTFGTVEIYIPNYTGNNYKQIITDNAAETNSSTQYMGMHSGLWQSTSGITSLTCLTGGGNYLQYSTFSLYGVLRQGI